MCKDLSEVFGDTISIASRSDSFSLTNETCLDVSLGSVPFYSESPSDRRFSFDAPNLYVIEIKTRFTF